MTAEPAASRAQYDASIDWLSDATTNRQAPLRDQIYAHLRRAIVTARAVPGATLNEPAIATHFGVSRTPVREALLLLRDDGLVDIWRQSGTFVTQIDRDRVEEGMIVREALEPRVAEIAAGKMTDRVLASLSYETDLMAKAAKRGDSREFIEADDRFHQLLVDSSGYLHIAQVIQKVNAQLDRVRYLSASEPTRAKTALMEHRALIDCLGRADNKRSATLLRMHLQGSWGLIRAHLDAQPLERHHDTPTTRLHAAATP